MMMIIIIIIIIIIIVIAVVIIIVIFISGWHTVVKYLKNLTIQRIQDTSASSVRHW